MKALLLITTTFLLISACTSEKDNPTLSDLKSPEIPQHMLKKIEDIKYWDSAQFAKANATIHAINKEAFESANPSDSKILFEKSCKQSKGYQKGIWEGKNDCSWAVEKKNLERFNEWATRQGDTLILSLKNNEVIEFVHDKSDLDRIVFFQFKNYLPQVGFFAVEEIQKDECRTTYLINENDGKKFTINGSLYFSNDQNTFLATSFSGEAPLACTNKIELYKLSNSQLTKSWLIPTKNWGVTDVKFINEKQFLVEQSTTGIPPEYKFYAKISTTN